MPEEKTELISKRIEEGGLLQPVSIHCMREEKLLCGVQYSDEAEWVDALEFMSLLMLRAGINICQGCFVEFNRGFMGDLESTTYHYLDPQTDDKKYLCGRELPPKPLPKGITPCMLCEYEFVVVRNQNPEKLKYGFRSDRWGRRSKGLRGATEE